MKKKCLYCGVKESSIKTDYCCRSHKTKHERIIKKGIHISKCPLCNSEFTQGIRNSIYCTEKCRQKNKDLVKKETGYIRPKTKGPFICSACNKEYYTNRRKGEGDKFCSLSCFRSSAGQRIHSANKTIKPGCKAKPVVYKVYIGTCNVCFSRYSEKSTANNRMQCRIRCTNKHQFNKRYRELNKDSHCNICNAYYSPLSGKAGLFCSQECIRESIKQNKESSKAKRRAVENGADAEMINPYKVFKLNNWTCQGCGCDTPKSLRGSHYDNAPELDHVIPISKGGSHTYDNVQTLCRRCNQLKSDKSMEMLIAELIRKKIVTY